MYLVVMIFAEIKDGPLKLGLIEERTLFTGFLMKGFLKVTY